MPKPLDPTGLEGAFAKGPPSTLDFLIPARPESTSRAPQKITAQPAKKATARTKKKAAKKKATARKKKTTARKKKTTARKKKTTARKKKTTAPAPEPTRVSAPTPTPVVETPTVYCRPVWEIGTPPLRSTLRERVRGRIDRFTGRILGFFWSSPDWV